ncbi:hypothetical protein FPV67DRAFT_614469 [Lyophyllum atratum]|nr:hypothetical protein FPV67DRAFT_614469 [Lyophyllum atratum]
MMKVSSMKAPESRGPRKIDVHLPGPVPKRARRGSNRVCQQYSLCEGQEKCTCAYLHPRSPLAVWRSKSRLPRPPHPPPINPRLWPVSSPFHPGVLGSPETEFDDGASVADSVMSTNRIRRTEVERMEYFKNEPECGTLEENRAECTRCGKFVALGRKQKYTVRPWEIHRAKCDQKRPKSPSGGDSGTQADADEEQGDDADKSKPRRAPSTTEEQRKTVLEADPCISVVKPHEVLCRNCGQWIRLSSTQAYKDYNWKTHSLSCNAAVPSKRVATATRKLQLVNDSQVKSFTSREVVCLFCDTKVTSNGEGDYNVVNWEEHKTNCTKPLSDTRTKSKKTSDPPAAGISTIPFPSRPPPSSASTSTEGTLIVSDPKQIPQVQGSKRSREDDDVVDLPADDTDARPINRPRTDTYEEPVQDAPGSSGWFMLPFQAFVRGFKESLKRP